MEDASPTKWHLAHVTWFFETFVLASHLAGYRIFDETFNYCFQFLLREPGHAAAAPQARSSHAAVDRARARLSRACRRSSRKANRRGRCRTDSEIARLIEVGINHEQQHQELLLTDILALFAANPLRPAYRAPRPRASSARARPNPLDRLPGRHLEDRARRQRLRLGQRGATSRRPHPPLPARRPSRHQRRMAGVHDRRRLSDAVALARRRLDHRQSRGLAVAALLGGARRRMARACRSKAWDRSMPPRPSHMSATTRPTPTRDGPESVSRLSSNGKSQHKACRMTGNTLATRALRTASRRCAGKRQAAPDVRRCLGVDPERLPSLSRLSPAARRARRIQRQVHGQSAGPARRVLRRRPTATRAPPTATSSIPTSAGSSSACASPRRSPDAVRQHRHAAP